MWVYILVWRLFLLLLLFLNLFVLLILRNLKSFSLMPVGCFARLFVSFFVDMAVLCYLKECDPTYVSTLDLFLSLLSRLSVGHPLIVTCFPGSQPALTLAFLPSPDFGALLGVHFFPRICHLSFHKILHEEGATYPKVGRPFSMNTMNNMTNNPYSHLLCEYQWVTLQTMKFIQQ